MFSSADYSHYTVAPRYHLTTMSVEYSRVNELFDLLESTQMLHKFLKVGIEKFLSNFSQAHSSKSIGETDVNPLRLYMESY